MAEAEAGMEKEVTMLLDLAVLIVTKPERPIQELEAVEIIQGIMAVLEL
jgi:hypothetical protein